MPNFDDENARFDYLIAAAQKVREAYERGEIPEAEMQQAIQLAKALVEIETLREILNDN